MDEKGIAPQEPSGEAGAKGAETSSDETWSVCSMSDEDHLIVHKHERWRGIARAWEREDADRIARLPDLERLARDVCKSFGQYQHNAAVDRLAAFLEDGLKMNPTTNKAE